MNIHEKFMNKCLALAQKAGSDTLPNPLVGSVIVKDGEIIGKGYHKKFGEAHAEVNAILNAKKDISGSDLYVNLEPCSHFGKTPPCVDLIINKKIKNVYIGMEDPNPLVSGKGISKLLSQGINVKVGILENKCRKLNEVFTKFINKKEAFITLKLAATLDGKIAEPDGNSKWISSNKSREFVHKLRFFSNAVLVGRKTLEIDNPSLNVRKRDKIIKEPYKIIVSKSLKINYKLKIFKYPEKIVIVTSEKNKLKNLNSKFKVLYFPENNGILNLTNLNSELYKLGIFNIIAEAGSFLSFYLLKFKNIDKVVFFYSNKIMGGKDSLSMIGGNEFFPLHSSLNLNNLSFKKVGNDIMVTGYPLYQE